MKRLLTLYATYILVRWYGSDVSNLTWRRITRSF